MKLNLKASVYAAMVEVDGNLVSLRRNGSHLIIAPVGASCSLVTSTTVQRSANSIYNYTKIFTCLGKVIATTVYRKVTVDGGGYCYGGSTATVTHLA